MADGITMAGARVTRGVSTWQDGKPEDREGPHSLYNNPFEITDWVSQTSQ